MTNARAKRGSGRANTASARARQRASLTDYRAKRNFDRTGEPKGGTKARTAVGKQLYVMQKHRARRLHFDLRLELDGVLKSWAITKGPSLDTTQKCLAVRTED
jgi:bifunctional non-homologous end joining protein LigD